MIQIGMVGCSHIHTPNFVKRLAAREDVRVDGVWDDEASRAKKTAGELGCDVKDLRSIWSDDAIEAVIICSRTNQHEELVAAATQAGKHLFVEKPLGMGSADAAKMADQVDKAGVIFQTGYFSRSSAVYRFIRKQVEAGHFGKITRIRGSNCHAGALGGWFDSEWRWMADPALAGCGAFGDLGTHLLDIMMWLIGDVQSVTGKLGVATGRYAGCDEYGEAMLQFADGIIGTLAAGWVDVADPVRLTISGTEGHAVVFRNDVYFKSQHVDGADGEKPWMDLPAALPHAFDLFLDAIAGKKNVELVGVHEAAARSRVMEGIYRASREGRWVDVR